MLPADAVNQRLASPPTSVLPGETPAPIPAEYTVATRDGLIRPIPLTSADQMLPSGPSAIPRCSAMAETTGILADRGVPRQQAARLEVPH